MFISVHPDYLLGSDDWEKWRYAYEGGRDFVNRYLVKLSSRETDDDFTDRKKIAYSPSFAKAAINDIKNAIFQRIADVTRTDIPTTYKEAIKGVDGGVDMQGNGINSFIGLELLPELLVMGKVGILVDAPSDMGSTLQEKQGKRPYIALYTRENILNWAPRHPINGYDTILLREEVDQYNDDGLPVSTDYRYRLYQKTPDGVMVTIKQGDNEEVIHLDIDRIPFTILELPVSLMQDVADYQIALLNVESSDISFVRKANYPFYYEFYDPNVEAVNVRKEKKEIKVGLTQGRRIPKTVDKPGFINPDPDTLRVSMEKSKQLKEDIRLLVNLNLQNMNPRRQSAESRAIDAHGLEAGLSFIGLVLQKAETQIAEYWDLFEREGVTPNIVYPRTYNLETESDRHARAERLQKLQRKIPSETFQKEIAKRIVTLTVNQASQATIKRIFTEIDSASTLTSDAREILEAHKSGLVDDVTAAKALGYPETSVEQARKDRAERIRLTLEAQGGIENASQARGAEEFGSITSQQEKEGKRKRGQNATTKD